MLILINIFIFLWRLKVIEDCFSWSEIFSVSYEPYILSNACAYNKYIYNNPFDYLINKKTYYKRNDNSEWILDLERNAIYNEKN